MSTRHPTSNIGHLSIAVQRAKPLSFMMDSYYRTAFGGIPRETITVNRVIDYGVAAMVLP